MPLSPTIFHSALQLVPTLPWPLQAATVLLLEQSGRFPRLELRRSLDLPAAVQMMPMVVLVSALKEELRASGLQRGSLGGILLKDVG